MDPDAFNDDTTPEVGPHDEAIAAIRLRIRDFTDSRETARATQCKQYESLVQLQERVSHYDAVIASLDATIAALNTHFH